MPVEPNCYEKEDLILVNLVLCGTDLKMKMWN
jgi:hypothetical protein